MAEQKRKRKTGENDFYDPVHQRTFTFIMRNEVIESWALTCAYHPKDKCTRTCGQSHGKIDAAEVRARLIRWEEAGSTIPDEVGARKVHQGLGQNLLKNFATQ